MYSSELPGIFSGNTLNRESAANSQSADLRTNESRGAGLIYALIFIVALLLTGMPGHAGHAEEPADKTPADKTVKGEFRPETTLTDMAEAMALFKKQAYSEAGQAFLPWAQKGNARAQTYLGWMYENGKGVTQDYKEAVLWYREAALQGNVLALYSLGRLFELGQGVPRDYGQAADMYGQAATKGFAPAQNNLGSLFERGVGMDRDLEVAAQLYKSAADKGNPAAMKNLGALYENGRGVDRDPVAAKQWYEKAAKLGYKPAQEKLRALTEIDSSREPESVLSGGDIAVPASMPQLSLYQTRTFSILRPDQWRIHQDESGRISLAGQSGEGIFIWPVFVQQEVRNDLAANMLFRLSQKAYPGVQWSAPQLASAGLMRMIGGNNNQTAAANLTWVNSGRGSACCLYLISAPRNVFRSLEPAFVQILQSFRVHGVPGGAQAAPARPNVRFVRWSDPLENAYGMEVPQGWNVQGGMQRTSAIDLRPWTRVVSPDGLVHIFMGDAQISYFAEPNQMLNSTGFSEGSWYSPGYGSIMMVMRYQPGVEFAMAYVPRILGGLTDFRFSGTRPRPDITQAIEAIYSRFGSPFVQTYHDAGETFFTCRANQHQLAGYTFGRTALTLAGGIGQWHVEEFLGFFAPPDRTTEAAYILTHMINTSRLNPEWAGMQQSLTGSISSIVTETNNYVSNVINQTFQDVQRRQDDVFFADSQARRGVERVHDERTGQTYEINSGSNYYWIDAGENIVGTETQSNPDGLRFEQMVRLD